MILELVYVVLNLLVSLLLLRVLHLARDLLVVKQVIMDGTQLGLRELDSFAQVVEVLGLLLDIWDDVLDSLLDARSFETLLLDVLNRHQDLSQFSHFKLFVFVVNLGLLSQLLLSVQYFLQVSLFGRNIIIQLHDFGFLLLNIAGGALLHVKNFGLEFLVVVIQLFVFLD